MAELAAVDVEDFCDYLEVEKGFDDDVVECFRRNAISRTTFLLLEEVDLKELVPMIGNRVKVRELLRTLKSDIPEVNIHRDSHLPTCTCTGISCAYPE